jgi:hypothetical protein
MKKFLLVLFLIAGVSQLKAQQLTLKSADSLLLKAPKNFNGLKLDDGSLFKNLSKLPKAEQLAAINNMNSIGNNTEIFYSRMPVLKVRSNDKMRVVGQSNIDRMPIKRIKVVDPLAKLQQPAP